MGSQYRRLRRRPQTAGGVATAEHHPELLTNPKHTMKILGILAVLWLIAFSSLFVPMVMALFGPVATACFGGILAVLATAALYEQRH